MISITPSIVLHSTSTWSNDTSAAEPAPTIVRRSLPSGAVKGSGELRVPGAAKLPQGCRGILFLAGFVSLTDDMPRESTRTVAAQYSVITGWRVYSTKGPTSGICSKFQAVWLHEHLVVSYWAPRKAHPKSTKAQNLPTAWGRQDRRSHDTEGTWSKEFWE